MCCLIVIVFLEEISGVALVTKALWSVIFL